MGLLAELSQYSQNFAYSNLDPLGLGLHAPDLLRLFKAFVKLEQLNQ